MLIVYIVWATHVQTHVVFSVPVLYLEFAKSFLLELENKLEEGLFFFFP